MAIDTVKNELPFHGPFKIHILSGYVRLGLMTPPPPSNQGISGHMSKKSLFHVYYFHEIPNYLNVFKCLNVCWKKSTFIADGGLSSTLLIGDMSTKNFYLWKLKIEFLHEIANLKGFIIHIFIFLSFEQKLIHLPSVYRLTDRLTENISANIFLAYLYWDLLHDLI